MLFAKIDKYPRVVVRSGTHYTANEWGNLARQDLQPPNLFPSRSFPGLGSIFCEPLSFNAFGPASQLVRKALWEAAFNDYIMEIHPHDLQKTQNQVT